MLKTCVLICTRNRYCLLKKCVESLARQTMKPDEIIIVDNGSTDETKNIGAEFDNDLKIKLRHCKRIGLPFARNEAIKQATGDILAFIDDDCVADKNWLRAIINLMMTNNGAVGVVGAISNATQNNIYSEIEYLYFYRWVLRSVVYPATKMRTLSGAFVDFKNAAFRKSFIDKFRFSVNAPYGDVGDEDVEIGMRLHKANKQIYYDPEIKVKHLFSQSLKRLWVRNFWNGYTNQMLKIKFKIDINRDAIHNSDLAWIGFVIKRLAGHKSNLGKFLTIILLLTYPFFSKLGRLTAWISARQKIKIKVPTR